jgi:formate-dependent nitrite reductase membrane component NrfD
LIIMLLKLPIHVAYLGRPWRFYRLFPPFSNAWKTSWFARGVLASVVFGMVAFVQLIIGHPFIYNAIGTPIAQPIYIVLGVIAGISALVVGLYGGMMMTVCKGIPFWNQGLLPIVFVLAGVGDGFGLIMGIGLAGGDVNMALAEVGSRYLILINIFLIICYLISANYTSNISKLSTNDLLKGNSAYVFWIGLVLFGLVIPAVEAIVSVFSGAEIASWLLITAITCHTLGAFALKYCLLKEGVYRPLLPRIGAY